MSEDQWGAGDKSKWSDHGTILIGQGFHTRRAKLIYGEHPHSRNDNKHYVVIDSMNEPVGFEGHRIIVDVQVESHNYLKSSYLSGDEIRKGGTCKIFFDKIQVYEFFFREPISALRRAEALIPKIMEHSLHRYWEPEEAKKLVGKLIFYREIPAIITSVIVDQGCIMVARRDGKDWPPAIYDETPEWAEKEKEVKCDLVESTTNLWFWDNPKAYVFRGLSDPGLRGGGLPRAEELHGDNLHGAGTLRGSGGDSEHSQEGDAGRPGAPVHGEARGPDLRAGGRPVVPRGPVEGAGLEPRVRRPDKPGKDS